MCISIAMCSYNGAAYIREQLQSIGAQTRLPDELVICDDGSTDATREILLAFQAGAPFAVRLHFNQANLGSTRNFAQAIGLCDGDVIVLADQDDVWAPGKLEMLERQFAGAPETGAVFSDAAVVDEALRPLGYTVWQQIGFPAAKQKMLEEGGALSLLLRQFVVTGATMAFHRRFRDLILPIPEGWVHDAWIALMISACAKMKAVNQPLILYRQHGGNQIGARRHTMIERIRGAINLDREVYYGEEIVRYQKACERLVEFPELTVPGAESLLREKLAHLRYRTSLPENRLFRLPLVLRELILLRYRNFSFGWQVAIKDILIP